MVLKWAAVHKIPVHGILDWVISQGGSLRLKGCSAEEGCTWEASGTDGDHSMHCA